MSCVRPADQYKGEGDLGACIARVSIAESDGMFAEGSLGKRLIQTYCLMLYVC